MAKVLIVGDSRRMRGGVSTVIQTLETTFVWNKYHCHWVQCQINSSIILKLIYLLWGYFDACIRIPFYDLVYFHTAVGNSLLVQKPILLLALLFNKKVILELHVGNQLTSHLNDKSLIFAVNHSNLTLTLGKQWRDLLSSQPWIKTPVDYLYNPAPTITSLSAPHKYFLFAAYFDKNKGYDTLLEAFSTVIGKYPEWKLVLCGTGDLNDVKNSIFQNKIENNVLLPGWVTGEEKEQLFKQAYAYCMTSKQEGLPMTVLESLAYGVPVISSKVGCLPEFLSDGESVLFYNYSNSAELADKMITLIEDNVLRNRLSDNAQTVISQYFSKDIFANRIDEFISNLAR